MPIQKDLKKIVRTRMEKTGEAYTTARLHVVSKKREPEPPPPNYAEIAGMSDAALVKNTGRNWAEWVSILDAVAAHEKPHGEIAKYVSSLGCPDWWSQSVTVGYERIRGLREKGQRRGGSYEANKSRTFSVPTDKLYAAFANAAKRKRWLPVALKIRTAHENKTIRASMEDGTLVQFYFTAKGEEKSSVAIQQQKIADKESAEKLKGWWAERLDALAKILK
jgi:hypothetical protein